MGVIEFSKCRIIDLADDSAVMIIPHAADVTLGNVVTLAIEVRDLLRSIDAKSVVIDLEEVEHVDSTVVGWIFEMYKRTKERGGILIVVVSKYQPLDVLKLLNITALHGLYIVNNKAASIDILSTKEVNYIL